VDASYESHKEMQDRLSSLKAWLTGGSENVKVAFVAAESISGTGDTACSYLSVIMGLGCIMEISQAFTCGHHSTTDLMAAT
jgi:hypothetical protein